MTPRSRIMFFSISLILITTWSSFAQQSQHVSLSQLKEQYLELHKIDKDPDTPVDVREVNRSFLASRRTELQSALVKRINALRQYLLSAGVVLRSEEVQMVQSSIRGLEADLQNLSTSSEKNNSRNVEAIALMPGSTPISVRVIKSDELPPVPRNRLPAEDECPEDLIENVVISKNPTQNTLEITLKMPLSRTQRSDVIRDLNDFSFPANHLEYKIGDGTPTSVPFQLVSGDERKFIRINLGDTIPATATTVTVTLKDVNFDCPGAAGPVQIDSISKTGNISALDILLASHIEKFNKANKEAAAKRSSEKNFRLGFAAAKGDGEDAQGSADISINRTLFGGGEKSGTFFDLFDQADIALQIKKSTAKKDDPRHLTLGLNLRKSFLIDSRLKKSDAGIVTRSEAERRIKSKGFFRVLMINESFNLEGEAFDFKTTNFVSDTNLELASIAKKVGSGFWNLNIFGGPEIGRNLSKPDATTAVGATAAQLAEVDWITRLKAGGQLTLRLLPSETGDNWGVEFDVGYVNRHLFSSEVFTQETMKDGQTIKKLVTIGKGNRAWRQADLKVFLMGNDKGRYGVKLSYQNGQLPPAFTPTKGFQFGVVIESKDDTKGGEPANKEAAKD